ncbi:MAG TPA: Gfo/Idh/MocA family oxidoreductase [Candidatus Acidoferrales bacterium]|nr:Gfo/Idh/MocA family oxidoreductase [Candidatus Acidoferrales bacterium]
MSLAVQPGQKVRVAVVGAGDFGRNHARVYRELGEAELIGIVDPNPDRAAQIAAEFSTKVFPDIEALAGLVDAASVAVPTVAHARVGCRLMELGIDVLVEKPMAVSLAQADELLDTASNAGRILQVGHLERFNPAITAVMPVLNRPLYFEVHRLGVFTPRSLDIDVVYDVMIHDLDILLALVDAPVVDIKAIGIPVLTDKVDIAHARLDFETGAVANVTASRVSTERVRKMRFFQEHEYISLDFARQDALRIRVRPGSGLPQPEIGFEKLATTPEEPLRAELRAFVDSVRTRRAPVVDGAAGLRALELADRVMASILEHARRVQLSVFTPQEIR